MFSHDVRREHGRVDARAPAIDDAAPEEAGDAERGDGEDLGGEDASRSGRGAPVPAHEGDAGEERERWEREPEMPEHERVRCPRVRGDREEREEACARGHRAGRDACEQEAACGPREALLWAARGEELEHDRRHEERDREVDERGVDLPGTHEAPGRHRLCGLPGRRRCLLLMTGRDLSVVRRRGGRGLAMRLRSAVVVVTGPFLPLLGRCGRRRPIRRRRLRPRMAVVMLVALGLPGRLLATVPGGDGRTFSTLERLRPRGRDPRKPMIRRARSCGSDRALRGSGTHATSRRACRT